MVSWLSAEIDRTAAAHPNPGRTESFHRLNRAEYQNAIRDLLAIDVDVATLLPTDDADKRGFDNIADVLHDIEQSTELFLGSVIRKVKVMASRNGCSYVSL